MYSTLRSFINNFKKGKPNMEKVEEDSKYMLYKEDLSESFIIKMKNYINFNFLSAEKMTVNVINNCYEHIDKKIIKNRLNNKNILLEIKLHYEAV